MNSETKEEIKKGYEALCYVAQEELGKDGIPIPESCIIAKEVQEETNGKIFSYMEKTDRDKLKELVEDASDKRPNDVLDEIYNNRKELRSIFNVAQTNGVSLGKTGHDEACIYNSSSRLPEQYKDHLDEIKEKAGKFLDDDRKEN
ncbi:MAG: hypothetical protein ACLFTY_02390 [Candidatus Aenigmatarchaeota archaeon]